MKLPTLLPAALAALTIAGVAATASAAADYVTRAVPASSNPHEVFTRLVKVPKTKGMAATGDGATMADHAAMHAMCERMMRDHHAAPAPKG